MLTKGLRKCEPPTGSCLTRHLASEFSEFEKTVRRKQRVRRRARRRSKAATSSALESRASTSQDAERLRSWWTNKRYQRYQATFGSNIWWQLYQAAIAAGFRSMWIRDELDKYSLVPAGTRSAVASALCPMDCSFISAMMILAWL
jgi:hypothetical protein